MSYFDDLLSRYCPDGVVYKTLGELGAFYGGLTGKSKKDFENGNAVFVSYRNVYSNPALDIHPLDRVRIYEGEKQRTLQYGDVIFTGSSETPDECGFSSVVTEKPTEPLYLNSFCFFFRMYNPEMLLPDFAKHLFRSGDLRDQIGKTASGVTRFNVSKEKMQLVEVPVPPLEVQREIVRVLDHFTLLRQELSEKLSAELSARRKQYEYYRDELLTFGDDVPRVRLDEIATDMYRGSGIKRDEVTEIGVPCIRYGEIYTTYNTFFEECVSHTDESSIVNPKYFDYGAILFAITGESVEDIAKCVAYVGHERCMAGGDIVVMIHNQNPKYLSYALATADAREQKGKGKIKSKVVHSSVPALKEIVIPLPNRSVQDKIVHILDNYEHLCNDISSGLPAEIEARTKQYEYYRDKLLSFKRKEAV